MTHLTAFGRVIHDGLVVSYWGWYVRPTGADGVWNVHQWGQRPVEGVAVYRYSWGYECEQDGAQECIHIQSVRRYETR